MNASTHMRREIEEIPSAVATLLDRQHDASAALGAALRERDPSVLVTIARGSSDHAATFFKYAAERLARRPVASVGPSIASIYGIDLMLAGAAAIAISQSGKSPDLVAMLESAHRGGALGVAITNDPASPLAAASDHVIDIGAGLERSVAATKTFVTSIVAGLSVIAHWKGHTELLTALQGLSKPLANASKAEWPALSQALSNQSSIFVLGRGPGAAIAAEAALKFKETSGLHAESYSTAEVLHGPSAIVRDGFPVLVFAVNDAALPSVTETAKRLSDQGGRVFFAGPESAGTALPTPPTGHPLTDPLAQIVSFYAFVEAFSRARGYDPDRPPHLNKVTATQ